MNPILAPALILTLTLTPGMKEKINEMQDFVKCEGLYPVDDCLLFGMTCCNVMMDANLMLQIQLALKESGKEPSLRSMAPEILAICSGAMNPFDFNLTKQQHLDLYHSGQLCVHMHAALHTVTHGKTEEVSESFFNKQKSISHHVSNKFNHNPAPDCISNHISD